MKTTEFIRNALNLSARATMSMINDMQDALFTFPTPNGGNHPLWVLGHMAYVEGELVQHMMLGQPNTVAHWKSLFGPGSQPVADPAQYPQFEEIKTAFENLRAQTLKLLDTLGDADLDTPCKACPAELQSSLGTYAPCFMIIVFNTMTHRGQVADARRAAGRKPLRM